MTKHQRRDKESSAQSHWKESTQDECRSQACVLASLGGGNVKVACQSQRRKVTTKARIAVGSLRLHAGSAGLILGIVS